MMPSGERYAQMIEEAMQQPFDFAALNYGSRFKMYEGGNKTPTKRNLRRLQSTPLLPPALKRNAQKAGQEEPKLVASSLSLPTLSQSRRRSSRRSGRRHPSPSRSVSSDRNPYDVDSPSSTPRVSRSSLVAVTVSPIVKSHSATEQRQALMKSLGIAHEQQNQWRRTESRQLHTALSRSEVKRQQVNKERRKKLRRAGQFGGLYFRDASTDNVPMLDQAVAQADYQ